MKYQFIIYIFATLIYSHLHASDFLFSKGKIIADINKVSIHQDNTVKRERPIEFNFSQLPQYELLKNLKSKRLDSISERVILNLFDNASYEAEFSTIETSFLNKSTTIWSGKLIGFPYSDIAIAVTSGIANGIIHTGDGKVYEIVYNSQSKQWIKEMDMLKKKFHCEVNNINTTMNNLPKNKLNKKNYTTTSNKQLGIRLLKNTKKATTKVPTVDVMILYTTNAKNEAGGKTAIENSIQVAVRYMNQSFTRSSIKGYFQLVHMEEVPGHIGETFHGGGSRVILGDLIGKKDGYIDNIHSLRDQYGADLVQLIYKKDFWAQTAGRGDILNSKELYNDDAFSVADYSNLLDNFVSMHEFGHNLGMDHDINHQTAYNAGLYPYSHGYQSPTQKWRTIMSYKCNENDILACPRINYWSNPNIFHPETDEKMGSLEDDNEMTANAQKTLTDTLPFVSNYRTRRSLIATRRLEDKVYFWTYEAPSEYVAGKSYTYNYMLSLYDDDTLQLVELSMDEEEKNNDYCTVKYGNGFCYYFSHQMDVYEGYWTSDDSLLRYTLDGNNGVYEVPLQNGKILLGANMLQCSESIVDCKLNKIDNILAYDKTADAAIEVYGYKSDDKDPIIKQMSIDKEDFYKVSDYIELNVGNSTFEGYVSAIHQNTYDYAEPLILNKKIGFANVGDGRGQLQKNHWKFYRLEVQKGQVINFHFNNPNNSDVVFTLRNGAKPSILHNDLWTHIAQNTSIDESIVVNSNAIYVGISGTEDDLRQFSVKATLGIDNTRVIGNQKIKEHINETDKDYYKFKGKKGQKVDITLMKISGTMNLNTKLAIRPTMDNADCFKLDILLDGASKEVCTYTLTEDIDIYIMVQGWDDNSLYTLQTHVGVDTDKDGIYDLQDTDDDNDGLSDIVELKYGLNPLKASDAQADFDHDGFSNTIEIAMGTNIRNARSKPVWAPVMMGDIVTFVPAKP